MKVLRGDFYFMLPDDFEGSRADAIRLLANYDETTPDMEASPCGMTLWQRFISRRRGTRLVGVLTHQTWDGKAWRSNLDE